MRRGVSRHWYVYIWTPRRHSFWLRDLLLSPILCVTLLRPPAAHKSLRIRSRLHLFPSFFHHHHPCCFLSLSLATRNHVLQENRRCRCPGGRSPNVRLICAIVSSVPRMRCQILARFPRVMTSPLSFLTIPQAQHSMPGSTRHHRRELGRVVPERAGPHRPGCLHLQHHKHLYCPHG